MFNKVQIFLGIVLLLKFQKYKIRFYFRVLVFEMYLIIENHTSFLLIFRKKILISVKMPKITPHFFLEKK